MLFDTLKRRWFGVTTSTDNHHIFHVVGLSTRRGQAYQLQGIEVQQTVVTTPIPTTIWLFGSALAGLMGVSTRRKGFKALTA
jgi:glucose uptake protein GlcU